MYPRLIEPRVRTALDDTRVVALVGPRQSGKTTLARRFARQGRAYLTLDDHATLAAAQSDPVAFIRGLNRAVIDEVQRAPEILLAIKRSIDEDRRPGRFLLTGSANLAAISTVKESLAGRVETIPLYPLAQSELARRKKPPRFLSDVFSGNAPAPGERGVVLPAVMKGGYPEAIARRTEKRRQDWYRAYLEAMVERDIPDVATLGKGQKMPSLIRLAAQFAGQLTNLSELGRAVALDHKTTDHYLQVLEQLFLVRRIQPWSRNELSRIIKTPKLHFIDSGLLATLRGYSQARLRSDPTLLGPLLEGFVFSELLKATSWSEDHISIYHFRDKDQNEVDFVLENDVGNVVGIEVKAAASVNRRDFSGLERLQSLAGKRFIQGVLLYDGDHTLSFSDQMRAVPLQSLWS